MTTSGRRPPDPPAPGTRAAQDWAANLLDLAWSRPDGCPFEPGRQLSDPRIDLLVRYLTGEPVPGVDDDDSDAFWLAQLYEIAGGPELPFD